MPVTGSKIFVGPVSGQSYTSQRYLDMVFIASGQVQIYNLFLIILRLTFTLFLRVSCIFISSQGHFDTFVSFFPFSSNLLSRSCKHFCHRKRMEWVRVGTVRHRDKSWGWGDGRPDTNLGVRFACFSTYP